MMNLLINGKLDNGLLNMFLNPVFNSWGQVTKSMLNVFWCNNIMQDKVGLECFQPDSK